MTQSISLRLRGVSKFYGQVQALKPLDLEVAPGELLSLLGPSGCGKTTTLRIIAGFETPDRGDVLLGDRDVTDLPPNQRDLGMMFQNYGLFPHMSVVDNVAFGLRMRGMGRDARRRRALEMLDTVRLVDFADRMIGQMSGGQQQRVALARALVTDPKLLLLDEPLGALDKNLREQMQFELRETQKRLGITTILVTHDQEEALTMSDRIAVMRGGEVMQIGSPTEIYARPRSRFVSEFLGSSNLFEVAGRTAGGIRLALNGAVVPALAPTGATGPVAVRPERLALGPAGTGTLDGTLADAVFRGSYVTCEVMLPGRETPVIVQAAAGTALPPPGSSVALIWPEDGAVVLEDA
ncbi:ABC transporter ATP-binding protein [Thioclava kandeliae]|uniref:ABC transporter ATP-binding protein n=1 Tax=Thioclava kandeliae TaxID=3070818 RepID=A0ABV1SLR3_9RHOB